MKRFTSFMLTLLCAMVAVAGPTDLPQITTDLNNPIYYTIMNTRSSQPGGYMYFAGENIGIKDEQVVTLEDKHMFYFTGSHDALYVHNKATDKKLATIGNGDYAAGSWTAEGAVWAVGVSPKGGGLAFGPQGGLGGNGCWNDCNYKTNANSPDFTTWSANDDGSVFVVGLAEESSVVLNSFYTIEAPLFEQVQGVKKGLVVDSEGNLGWNTIDLTNKNHYWVPTQVNGVTVALKNLGTEKYLNGDKVGDYLTSTLKILGQGQYNIISNGTTVHANNHNGGANPNGNIVSWGGGIGSASAWQFVEQQDPDAVQAIEITYNFTYNGQPLDGYTQTVNTITGAEYPNITVAFPFGVSATKPEGTIAVEDAPSKTITIAVEENLPFAYAASYETITNWYYVNVRDDGPTYMYYDSNISYIKATETAVPADKKDAYSWAFIGDPFSGFEIVNLVAGETMVLSSPQAPSANQDPEQIARMVVKADATGNTYWDFVKPTHNGAAANGFYIQHPTATTYAINRQGYNGANTLCYWNGRDTGSTFQVVECDMTGLADLQAYIAQVEAAIAAYGQGGTTVGYYTAESTAALAAALAEAKAAAEANTSAAANAAAQTALQNAVAALETIQPTEGAFYTIKNAYTNNYMNVSHESGATVYGSAALNEVFQFVPASEGKFYLYNVKRAKYLSTAKAHASGQNLFAADDTNNAKAVTIANLGLVNRVSIVPEGGAEMHNDTNHGNVVGWNTNGNADSKSAWVIEEVGNLDDFVHTLTVGETGYATLCLGCNVAIPDGVKAYAVASTNSTHAVMEEITGAIPAKQAVIIVAEQGEYNFKYAESAEAVEANLLKGTTVNANIAEEAYVLSAPNNEVGFYEAKYNVSTNTENDGTAEEPAVTYEAWLNNAFKAYLPKTAGMNAASYSFRFGEGTTGVENVVVENEVKAIYDLTGRRVENISAPGIYIVGGKKVLVR